MPAPPLESEPPITSTVGFGFIASLPCRKQRHVVMTRISQPCGCSPGAQARATTKHHASVARDAQRLCALDIEPHARLECRHWGFTLTAQFDNEVVRCHRIPRD